MRTLISTEELTSFRRCRRQWELGSPSRQNLEPIADGGLDLADAIREALAVYYFPGMWDWDRSMVERLSLAALPRFLPAASPELDVAEAILARYFRWALAVDRFAPIRVTSGYEARVPDPRTPGQGLLDARGMPVDCAGRIDLLVTDEADRYWAVHHRISRGAWTSEQQLRLSDADIIDSWGWQTAYPGLTIVGTISNELRIDLADAVPMAPPSEPTTHVAQNVAGGGGRSFPQHQRAWVGSDQSVEEVRVDATDAFRRTWIARSPREFELAGTRVGSIALDMLGPNPLLYPTPSADHCPTCPFQDPCVAMSQGRAVDELLTAYRPRQPAAESGRIGDATWGTGRGAAPPRWRSRQTPDARGPGP